MRCFVPVGAGAERQPRLGKSSAYRSEAGAVARQRGVNLANTGKRRIFFYLLSSIIPSGRDRSDRIGPASDDRRGDYEIWDTWLDSERRHSAVNRRRGARIMPH